MKSKIRPYIVSVAVSLAVGALSAFFTRNTMDIYSTLSTPPLAPPSFLFPIVWTVLYVLMGISAAMIYKDSMATQRAKEGALTTYAASLVFNFTWSIIFFNRRLFLFAFVWLLVLLALIIKTIVDYAKINKTAAYLQIPYALWVTFAGYLNLGIWWLNR